MNMSAERRYTPVPVELRAGGDKMKRIGGYAAVFGRESRNLGGFVEILSPVVFNDSKSRGWPDVMARYNHDDNQLLGTTGGGTLRLVVDATGLDYVVDMPNARADVSELVERGDVRKSSFAFRTLEDTWTVNDQGYPLRTLNSAQLIDVAPVNSPAYTDTSAGTRGFVVAEAVSALESLAKAMKADPAEVRSMAEADDLRKFFIRTDNRGRAVPKPAAAPKPMARASAASILAGRLIDVTDI